MRALRQRSLIRSVISSPIGKGAGKLQHKQGQIGRHDLPHNVMVDVVVAVDEPVSQTDDRHPAEGSLLDHAATY